LVVIALAPLGALAVITDRLLRMHDGLVRIVWLCDYALSLWLQKERMK
jgi:hypothetical protein